MTTQTDAQWTARLASIMPENFMDNISGQFAANNGILNTMINRIGMTLIHSPDTINNPFGDFTKSVMDYGDTTTIIFFICCRIYIYHNCIYLY